MKAYRIRTGMLMQAAGTETLDTLAHDLRTPMSCVSGAAQIALTANSQGKGVEEQLRQILAAVASMDAMLTRMCGHSTGKSCTAVQIGQALQGVMGQKAMRKRQKLSVDLSAIEGMNLPDGDALERVLLNLVSNAIKYTQENGRICVSARREENCAVITVADNGMGMKREFMRRMFVPYERAKESEHLPGHGLGLPIVRRLVREIGGRISVRSAWGKGTVFIVRIPLPESSQYTVQ